MICERAAALVLALGLVLLFTGRVGAQPAAASCAENAECAARYREAQLLSKSGAHEQALEIFTDIHRQYADPVALYPIAVMYDRLSRPADAAAAYQRYLDSGVETDPGRVAKIREQLGKARELAASQPRATAKEPAVRPPLPILPAGQPRGTVPAAQAVTSSSPRAVPLYKKGWFWAVVGGSAAAIGLGVGLGVGLGSRSPSLPDGINTYAATF